MCGQGDLSANIANLARSMARGFLVVAHLLDSDEKEKIQRYLPVLRVVGVIA